MKRKRSTMVIGARAVIETILAGQSVAKICVYEGSQDNHLRRKLWSLAKERGIPCTKVPSVYLQRLTSKKHQGAVAFVSPIPFVDIGHVIQGCFEEGRVPLVVLLDRVQDMRNVGAIARTALAMGVDALVIPKHGGALIGEDAMKTSAGALNHLAVCRVDTLKEAMVYLRESGLQVLVCDEKARKPVAKADLLVPTALLFGGEATGITPVHRAMADDAFLIPMRGPIASLNVSVAVSMVLYECARQRMDGLAG